LAKRPRFKTPQGKLFFFPFFNPLLARLRPGKKVWGKIKGSEF